MQPNKCTFLQDVTVGEIEGPTLLGGVNGAAVNRSASM